MSKPSKFAKAVTPIQPQEQAAPTPAAPVTSPPAPALAEAEVRTQVVRMLGGRVPDSIFREFNGRKEGAELALGVRKVTNEQSIEALVRALRDPAVLEAWHREVRAVRGEGR